MIKEDSSTKCWNEIGTEWIQKAQTNDFRIYYIMPHTFSLLGDVQGKKLLDLPENEKQPFVLARISEKRQLFRSKSSWKKLKENTTYG